MRVSNSFFYVVTLLAFFAPGAVCVNTDNLDGADSDSDVFTFQKLPDPFGMEDSDGVHVQGSGLQVQDFTEEDVPKDSEQKVQGEQVQDSDSQVHDVKDKEHVATESETKVQDVRYKEESKSETTTALDDKELEEVDGKEEKDEDEVDAKPTEDRSEDHDVSQQSEQDDEQTPEGNSTVTPASSSSSDAGSVLFTTNKKKKKGKLDSSSSPVMVLAGSIVLGEDMEDSKDEVEKAATIAAQDPEPTAQDVQANAVPQAQDVPTDSVLQVQDFKVEEPPTHPEHRAQGVQSTDSSLQVQDFKMEEDVQTDPETRAQVIPVQADPEPRAQEVRTPMDPELKQQDPVTMDAGSNAEDVRAEPELKAEDVEPDLGVTVTVSPLTSEFEGMASEVAIAQEQSEETAKDAIRVASFLRGAGKTASKLKQMSERADEATQLRAALKTCTKDVSMCVEASDAERFSEVIEKMKKQLVVEKDGRVAAETKLEKARKQMSDLGYSI